MRLGRAGTIRRAALPPLCAIGLMAASLPVDGLDLGEFSAAALSGDGWHASDVTLELGLAENGTLSAYLRAAKLRLPQWQIELGNIQIACPVLLINTRDLECARAQISLRGLPLDASRFSASFRFNLDTGAAQLALPALQIAGGRAGVNIQTDAQGWRAQLMLSEVGLAGFKKAAARWVELPLPDGVDGKLESRLRIGGSTTVEKASGSVRLYAISGSNEAGTLAAENLGAEFNFNGQLQQAAWQLDVDLQKAEGQVYALPIFVDFANNPLQAKISLSVPEEGAWPISFTANQSGVGQFAGELTLDRNSAALRTLALTSARAELPGAYDVYLQPFLVGTTADSLETSGVIDLTAGYSDATLKTLRMQLDEVHLDDKRGRFALYGLQGNIDWRHDTVGQSMLAWEGGYLYKVGLGQTRLAMETGLGAIALAAPTVIPVLDGRLAVTRFRLSHSGASLRDLEFEADIEAIGLRALSRALGWPPFSGTLSGRIPRMRLADNAITVAGAMSAQVFDGLITVDNLRVSEPFGVLPQVNADVRIRALDLAALSATFSFGKMQGRLDGDFNNLRMLGFSPVGFDARLYTTPGDRSRHRISQQAIENISDLGGAGAAAVLSRGLLRFFEDFAYDKIGWSCRLEDEVCSMSGVAPAPGNGYYIVKGKGLPRINVIGYRSRVSWPTLVAKLSNINASGASLTP